MNWMRTPLAVVLFLILCASSAQAEESENPQFAAWSKYAVGSTVMLESKEADGVTMQSTRVLKESAADHVVIEVTTVLEKGGKKQPSRVIPRTIKAKLDKGLVSQGSEKITAAGKTYDCTIYAMDDAAPNYIGTHPRIWLSPDVPGGIVRVDMTTPLGVHTQLLKTITTTK